GPLQHSGAWTRRRSGRARRAVVGQDDPWSSAIAERLRSAGRGWVDLVSAREQLADCWHAVGTELVARAPWTGPLGAFADLAGVGSLRGRHNIQNALAASACALGLGVSAGARRGAPPALAPPPPPPAASTPAAPPPP